jgi:competence protein ComEC
LLWSDHPAAALEALSFNWRVERESGRLFLWLPVALASGIGAYFALPVEPAGWVFVLAALALAALLHAGRMRRASASFALVAAVLAGFILAKLDTALSGTPLLASVTEPARFEGIVLDIDRRVGRRATLVIHLTALESLPLDERPERIRLMAPLQAGLHVGAHISGTARLFPLVTPVAPGAFDYGRTQWLRGIGANGRAVAPLEIRRGQSTGLFLHVKHRIELLRLSIGKRIAAILPGNVGAFATALVTGDRGDISASTNASLQASGLAHIISISGLHMSLVAGGFFWIVRALLALSPALAVNWPIKKLAALGALAVGAFYLLLSGGEVPTQRSYVMLAIMFGAILVDRPALSLRNVAIAALVILAMEPASALEAGFQMSFLAVSGLVSFYEAVRERRRLDASNDLRSRLLPEAARRVANILILAAATSMIAGLSTGPVAAFHFNRIAAYGLLANLLALPVVSFIIMPMALAAVLLMPLGLEGLPLAAMGFGLEAVMVISDWTAGLPGAQIIAPSSSLGAAVVMSLGILWVCILKTGLRWWGGAIFALGLLLSGLRSEPDILIERTARNVAVRNSNGDLVPALPRRSRFTVERWLLSDGDGSKPPEAHRRPGWSCKPEVCLATTKGRKIAFLTEQAEQDFSCPEVDLVIAAFPLRGRCRNAEHRIDRFDVWRHGAYAVYLDNPAMKIVTVSDRRGLRPWVVEPKPRKRSSKTARYQ